MSTLAMTPFLMVYELPVAVVMGSEDLTWNHIHSPSRWPLSSQGLLP